MKILFPVFIALFVHNTHGNICQEVQEWREKALTNANEDHEITNKQEEFNHCVLNVMDNIAMRREADIDTIMQYAQSKGLRRASKKEQMRLFKSIIGFNSFYSYFEGHYQSQYIYSHFAFIGPAIELHTALLGGIEDEDEDGNKVLLPIYQRAGLDILDEQKNPVDFLLTKLISRENSIGPYPSKENFSPAIGQDHPL